MLGELDALRVDATEIDEALHPRVPRGLGGDQRGAPVDLGEAGLGERVHEVEHDVGVLAGGAHGVRVEHVARAISTASCCAHGMSFIFAGVRTTHRTV